MLESRRGRPPLADPTAPGRRTAARARGAPPSRHPARRTAPRAQCAKCGAPLAPGRTGAWSAARRPPGALHASPGWRSAAAILGATACSCWAAAAAATPRSPNRARRARGQTVAQAPAPPPATADRPPRPRRPAAPPATPATPAPAKAPPRPASKPPKIPLTAKTTTDAQKDEHHTKHRPRRPNRRAKPNPSSRRSCSTPTPPRRTTPRAARERLRRPEPRDRRRNRDRLDRPGRTRDRAEHGRRAADRPEGHPALSAVEVITATPGMTAQVYGSNASAAPPNDHLAGMDGADQVRGDQEAPRAHRARPLGHRLSLRRAVDQQGTRVGGRNAAGARPREHQRTGTVRRDQVARPPRARLIG